MSLVPILRPFLAQQAPRHCLTGVALAAALSLTTPDASASCVAPPDAVLWSSPADGEREVPLDADLLIVLSGELAQGALTLDGSPLAPASELPGHYELGSLEPATRYTIEITSGTVVVNVGFETGTVELEADASAILGRASLHSGQSTPDFIAMEIDSGPCFDALYNGTCYDMALPNLYSFGAWMPPLAWVAGRAGDYRMLPSTCGYALAWTQQTYAEIDAGGLEVFGIEADGTIRPTEVTELLSSDGSQEDPGFLNPAAFAPSAGGAPQVVMASAGAAATLPGMASAGAAGAPPVMASVEAAGAPDMSEPVAGDGPDGLVAVGAPTGGCACALGPSRLRCSLVVSVLLLGLAAHRRRH